MKQLTEKIHLIIHEFQPAVLFLRPVRPPASRHAFPSPHSERSAEALFHFCVARARWHYSGWQKDIVMLISHLSKGNKNEFMLCSSYDPKIL